ncbi:DUF4365 domain-containing protein [Methylobacterium sp. WL12]|uniref:DUF4365 domain-containing protein n=1 Tax=Methylobacterium sp. WL12 TaxID=2603890 RepID=UPI0011C715BA|nr:DUF4365 domain-containing protein [Methylobacterium sp. WL12]TXM72169.1 DUF4365 domain-containing protein [Methylobacterium sp. WL12]
MISREHTQEALSLAYVHALAGRAGLNIVATPIFDYGIDGYFYPVKMRGRERVETGFPVRFQMKASVDWDYEETNVVYDLEARAHRTIADREPGEVMTILILLCLPRDVNQWLTGSETEMYLRHCCYWYRTSDPPTENSSTRRIRIPRTNLLTPTTLQGIMALAREEAMAGR